MRWELATLGGIALLGIVWRAVMGSHLSTSYLNVNLLGTITWFAGGMLLASLEVGHPDSLARLRRLLSRTSVCWPLGVAFFFCLVLGLQNDLGGSLAGVIVLQTVFYGLAAGLLLAPAILGDTGRVVGLTLSNRALVFLGTVSYGIYLWHYSMIAWLDTSNVVLTSSHPVLTLAVLVTALTLALAIASWYLVEKPLMKRAKSVKAFDRVRRGKVELAEAEAETEAGGAGVGRPAAAVADAD